MSQQCGIGSSGLVLDEPLIWEKSRKGRKGFSSPRRDVPKGQLPPELLGPLPDLPELNEVDIVRHYTRLSQWNFGIDTGMYPLGSCTMKYNPKTNERQARLPGFADAHPLLPPQLSQGLLHILDHLSFLLAEISGMDATTLQPAAGAQGELCGMLIFKAYHKSKGQNRTKIIVPDTAHGTNPASAALCGFQPIPVPSNPQGILDPQTIAAVMDDATAGIMVTNPNTLGFFEENIVAIAEIVHAKGGLVYGDGANLNAIMGIVQLGQIGVDLVHINLHKTFSTPHGGGGPGAGPVCVKKHLEPFLPVPRIVKTDGNYHLNMNYPLSIGRLQSFHGNVGVLIRAYAYILSMGGNALKKAAQLAVLNANYLKEKLKFHYQLPYDRPCMHECVFSDKMQQANQISTLDIVKRLMDYGFHPPTIYFPLVVKGALMIEPTETESKDELDRFIRALIAIAAEAQNTPDRLRSAPHSTKVTRLDEVAAARKPCLCR